MESLYDSETKVNWEGGDPLLELPAFWAQLSCLQPYALHPWTDLLIQEEGLRGTPTVSSPFPVCKLCPLSPRTEGQDQAGIWRWPLQLDLRGDLELTAT